MCIAHLCAVTAALVHADSEGIRNGVARLGGPVICKFGLCCPHGGPSTKNKAQRASLGQNNGPVWHCQATVFSFWKVIGHPMAKIATSSCGGPRQNSGETGIKLAKTAPGGCQVPAGCPQCKAAPQLPIGAWRAPPGATGFAIVGGWG